MAKREDLAIIRAARAGQSAAQLALGKRYLFGGNGLPQSFATALHWLDRAAHQQEAEAWVMIGSHIPLEIARSANNPLDLCVWYERAFDAGVMQAGLVLAQLVLNCNALMHSQVHERPALKAFHDKAMTALAAAAHAGIAEAQWLLAQHTASTAAVTEASRAEMALMSDTTAQNHANKDAENVGCAMDIKVAHKKEHAIVANDDEATDWTARAANAGVMQAQRSLAQFAWDNEDMPGFLARSLPLARAVMQQFNGNLLQMHTPSEVLARQMGSGDVTLLTRCAQALMATAGADLNEIQQLLELAASADDKSAQLSLGLWHARMDHKGGRIVMGAGSANYKKAIRWLTAAGERGSADAWYALSRIYLKSEFSQRNLVDMQRHLERAAEMGHSAAQLECGVSAWRNRRENLSNDVQAVYWLQKAVAQGSDQAQVLLAKIADYPEAMAWSLNAKQQLTRELINSLPFLAARIELAVLFGLSRPEALL
ncbi:MAG: sel1 repeat family protein, partial [Glaciimonas sp.]|nr:sel1 repeat family protein [Glaciimonas sp.]